MEDVGAFRTRDHGEQNGVGRGEKAVGDGGRQEEECVCEAEGTGECCSGCACFSFVKSFALQQHTSFWRTTVLQQVSLKKAQWLV